jgi:hypothetical protein
MPRLPSARATKWQTTRRYSPLPLHQSRLLSIGLCRISEDSRAQKTGTVDRAVGGAAVEETGTRSGEATEVQG